MDHGDHFQKTSVPSLKYPVFHHVSPQKSRVVREDLEGFMEQFLQEDQILSPQERSGGPLPRAHHGADLRSQFGGWRRFQHVSLNLKWGTPSYHPFSGIFSDKPAILWIPIYGKPPSMAWELDPKLDLAFGNVLSSHLHLVRKSDMEQFRVGWTGWGAMELGRYRWDWFGRWKIGANGVKIWGFLKIGVPLNHPFQWHFR